MSNILFDIDDSRIGVITFDRPAKRNAFNTEMRRDLFNLLRDNRLQSLTAVRLNEIGYYHFGEGKVLGADAIVSRTGYTGEDGFEIDFSPEHSESLWNGIVDAGGP